MAKCCRFKSTWDNILCDPQIVVSLAILCIRFMYILMSSMTQEWILSPGVVFKRKPVSQKGSLRKTLEITCMKDVKNKLNKTSMYSLGVYTTYKFSIQAFYVIALFYRKHFSGTWIR